MWKKDIKKKKGIQGEHFKQPTQDLEDKIWFTSEINF